MRKTIIGTTFISVILCGCAHIGGNDYNVADTGQPGEVYTVQIKKIKKVQIHSKSSTSDNAAIGGLIGGIGGALFGGDAASAAVGAGAGAVAGAVGSEAVSNQSGVQLTYIDHDGADKILVEGGNVEDFKVGDATETITHTSGKVVIRIQPNAKD